MKKIILLCSFIFLSSVVFGQTSFKDRLAFNYKTEKVDVKVFPNPVTTYFKVSKTSTINKVEVFNLTGRVVKKYNFINGREYFVGDLPKGIYLVQFTNKKGKTIATKRISKR